MIKRTAALALAVFGAGCVKEISNEERLERETARIDVLKSALATELLNLKCDELAHELPKARDENANEERRVSMYAVLYEEVHKRSRRFDEALSREPDLAYQEGSQPLLAARERCTQTDVETRLEFETLVREIVAVPIVDEYRDGKATKAPRIDFTVLRAAIEKLNPDDKEALLGKLAHADKQFEEKEPQKKKREK